MEGLPLFDGLDDEGSDTSSEDEDEEEDEDVPYKQSRKIKKKRGRKGLSKHLERKTKEYAVDPSLLPNYDPRHGYEIINYEISEELRFRPAQYWVMAHKRPVVRYKNRNGEWTACTVGATGKVFPKCSASPEILARVAVDRLDAALTLYRIERRFADAGCPLSRSTLCMWMVQLGWLLEPIQDAQMYELLQGPKIHLDDTSIRIQDKKAREVRSEKIWVFLGGDPEAPEIVYKATASRTKNVVLEFLSTYTGYLQVDACSVYDELFRRGLATEVGCWSHVYRKFEDLKAVESRVSLMLRMIHQLAKVEEAAEELDAPTRKIFRDLASRPILSKVKAWVQEHRVLEMLDSGFKKALNYVHNQWEHLNRFLEDGELSLDNNVAESEFHAVGITRRNHLFWGPGTIKSGMVLLGLIRTCRKHDINPYDYLCDVIPKMSQGGTPPRDLIPTRWKRLREEKAQAAAQAKANPLPVSENLEPAPVN